MLGETTEVYGAEHLLTRRARTPEVAPEAGRHDPLVGGVHRVLFGATIDNNPSPGNKLGGLTTIYEKSLGAVAKAGSTPLNQVVGYGERVTERGFVHMDTPGYDPVSVTGQVAGGCNIVAFTTGRGSAFGFKPAPSIKIATNSELYANQEPDMDINAGKVLDGVTPRRAGQRDLRGDPGRRLGQADEERARRGRRGRVQPLDSRRDAVGAGSHPARGLPARRSLSTRRGAGSGTLKSKENRPEELGQRLLLLGIE